MAGDEKSLWAGQPGSSVPGMGLWRDYIPSPDDPHLTVQSCANFGSVALGNIFLSLGGISGKSVSLHIPAHGLDCAPSLCGA